MSKKAKSDDKQLATTEGMGEFGERYPILDKDSEVGKVIAENVDLGLVTSVDISAMPQIKIPVGGGTSFTYSDAEGVEHVTKEIKGCLIHVEKGGTLWGSSGTGGSSPVLVTRDLKTGYQVSNDFGELDPDEFEKVRLGPKTFDWQKLLYCQWGSAENGGRGKRCKEHRILTILPEGEVIPVRVYASPMSCKVVDNFISALCFKRPIYRNEIGISLEKKESKTGNVYSALSCRFISELSEPAGEALKSLFMGSFGQAPEPKKIEGESFDDSDAPF